MGSFNRIRGSIDQVPPNAELDEVIRRVNEQNAQIWDKSTKQEQDIIDINKELADLKLLIRKVQNG